MITILHGEDITGSRRAIPDGAIKIEAKAASAELLAQLLDGGSLFDEKKVVVIENAKKLPDGISADLILWFDHKLTSNQLQQFPDAKVTEFKLSQVVFRFLESIRPGNQKEMLLLFEKYCGQEMPEIILSMIVRQFRLMLNPSELTGWQKDKITTQANKFIPGKLNEIYHQLAAIDYKQKTGQSASDLKGSLELFLLTL